MIESARGQNQFAGKFSYAALSCFTVSSEAFSVACFMESRKLRMQWVSLGWKERYGAWMSLYSWYGEIYKKREHLTLWLLICVTCRTD